MISKEKLEEFKKLHKEQFGEELSDEEVSDKATRLLSIMKLIYKPISKKQ